MQPEKRSPAQEAAIATAETEPGRILILDNDTIQVMILKFQMEEPGAHVGIVSTFTNARDALEFYGKNRIEVAIVDQELHRGDITGLEMLQAVRRLDPDVSLILRTGMLSNQVKESLPKLAPIEYLIKGDGDVHEIVRMTKAAILKTRERRLTSRQLQG